MISHNQMKTCRKCGGLFDGKECRLCKKISDAKWQRENPDKVKIINAKWRAANAVKKKEADARYRTEHRHELNEAHKKWLSENPDKRREYAARNRAKNAATVKAGKAAWRRNNPDKVKAGKAASYVRNKAKVRTVQARRYEANSGKIKTAVAKYRASHPEAKRIWEHNREARKRADGGVLSRGLAERLFTLQKGKCACCGLALGAGYQLDHIMPLALGGENKDSNIQLLKRTCNMQKHAKHPVDFMQQRGFLL